MLLIQNLRDSIAVVITCHKYEHFLPEAIDSVLQQNVAPREIIVVDDKPEDQSPTKCQQVLQQYPNITYLRTDFGDPLKAREAGFKASSSKYLCFLDADDQLGKNYLQDGLEKMVSTGVSVIFSDIEYFGAEERTARFSTHMPPSRISIVNFMHVGCLVTRKAIVFADAFNHPPLTGYQEDWMFWRKILHVGYRIARQDSVYRARVHDSNRSKDLLTTIGYYGIRGIEAATITFASDCRLIHKEFLIAKQNWPADKIHMILYHLHRDPHHALKSLPPNYSIVSNTDRINHAARVADTDYIFYCNEFLDYPLDICEQLLRKMSVNVGGVHNTEYELFDCSMVATKIMRETLYTGGDLEFPGGINNVCY